MSNTNDLTDSKDDQKHLKADTANLDLPEITDIPGQENVRIPAMGELADTTISSDDEEGIEILNDDNDSISNVTSEEKTLLQRTSVSMASEDDINLQRSQLDRTDFDGVELNEKEDVSGKDLDVPGEQLDDANEEIGEEDEENNEYSLGGERHDD